MRRPVAGLLLAAGEGRRLGGPKALVSLQGELLVERGVRLLVEGGCDPVVVVVGAAADEVAARASLGGARTVRNHDWASGLASSFHAGLDALSAEGARAVVVALADQPLVGSEAVRRLVDAWRDGASVAVAAYDGVPRNPVLLDRAHWPDAAAAAGGDRGARALLHARPDLMTLVECGDTGSPVDIDTPDDLEAIRARLAAEDTAT